MLFSWTIQRIPGRLGYAIMSSAALIIVGRQSPSLQSGQASGQATRSARASIVGVARGV